MIAPTRELAMEKNVIASMVFKDLVATV